MSARDERVKLTATGLNTFGVGIAITGYVSPLLGKDPKTELDYDVLIWLIVGMLLHLAGRWSLGVLDDFQ